MLNETVLEKLAERLVSRIEYVNSFILTTIGKQIKEIGMMTPSKANDLVNVLKYGGSFDKIIAELVKITQLNEKDIYNILEEMAKENYKFAKEFYKFRDKPYVTFEDNLALQQEIKALAKATMENYTNISKSLGFRLKGVNTPLAQAYQNIIDESIIAVSQGKDTFYGSMRKTIKELGNQGIRYVDWESGYSRRLDSTVRMNIQEGMLDLHNKVQEVIGEQVEADGVEISVHQNPAKDHELIQGKQYSNEDYVKLNDELERPISTLNCRHYVFSIILGVSEPNYSEKELQEILDKNNNGFEHQGKHYTMYEGTQLQRRIETEIRRTKELETIAKASGDDETKSFANNKIKDLMTEYKKLNKVSGLLPRMERLR